MPSIGMKHLGVYMKKRGIIIIILILVAVGVAMADPGIPKVNEVQGLGTSTTVIATGNFNAACSVDLTISKVTPITDLPAENDEFLLYHSVYTEDTQNSEIGAISYDKDLDVSTANKVSGQYNIQAVKQITYLGFDASSVATNDYLLLDSAGASYGTAPVICPFNGAGSLGPSLCNRVETGSAMNLKVANLNTQLGDRFIMKSADPDVEVFDTVGVSSYASGLPSSGSVSAYIKGSIKEGKSATAVLAETVTFSDSTAISGSITSYAKSMNYKSSL
jgi:hypothetical protein